MIRAVANLARRAFCFLFGHDPEDDGGRAYCAHCGKEDL